jgi:methylase of polypeptide subunit release factors
MNPSLSLPPSDAALVQLGRSLQAAGYSFTTITPLTHERVNRRSENAWAHDAAGVFGWSRPFRSGVLPAEVEQLAREAQVLAPHEESWRSRVRFSSLGGQLFVHSAFPTSEADSVFFGPDTYRFATAIRDHFASSAREVRRVVDIGCGAGPGAILCALERPQAQVLAVDINDRALRLARVNASLAEAGNVEARHSDLLSGTEGEFDLIVANPPYLVDASERAYRHGGGPLGAGLSLAIVDAALERLSSSGTLLLYTGVAMLDGRDPFHEEIERRLPSSVEMSYREMDPDVFGEELECEAYARCDRIAAIVLTISKG